MTGNSENNRSERQAHDREVGGAKEVRSEGTTVGTRTAQRGRTRAMSVLRNAKSNQHRKTRTVEAGGTGRKFMHLTRGGLPDERKGEVSRGRSSEESRGNPEGAKGRRTNERATANGPREPGVKAPGIGGARQLRQLPRRATVGNRMDSRRKAGAGDKSGAVRKEEGRTCPMK
jgi:hypothetical protein